MLHAPITAQDTYPIIDARWVMKRAHKLLAETYPARWGERPAGAQAWAMREAWRLAKVASRPDRLQQIAWHWRCIDEAQKLPLHMSMSDRQNKHTRAIMELEGKA